MNKLTLAVVATTAVAVSGGGAAFTNTNTVDASKAGVGSATVSGATLTDLDYTTALNATSGKDEITAVAFTANATMAGQKVIVRLKAAGVVKATADNVSATDLQANDCTVDVTTPTRASCAFTTGPAELAVVDAVEIVVYDND